MIRRFLVFLCLCLSFCGLANAAAINFTPAEEARYQGLISQLRCLVCQNQTIAESNAPLAEDLRRQVASMMQSGRSDDEILDYLTQRYGDFVLYKPPVKRSTWVLWAGPFVLLISALLIPILLFQRGRRAVASKPPDAEMLRKILQDTEQDKYS